MVCNGLYVHSFVNTDCNNTRRYAPRLARRGRVEFMELILAFAIISVILNVIILIFNAKHAANVISNNFSINNKLVDINNKINDTNERIVDNIRNTNRDNITVNSNFNKLYNSIKGTNERIDNIHAEILVLKNKAEISFNNSKSNNTINKSRKFDNKPKKAKNGNITTK